MIVRGATEEDVRAALEVADYGYHNLCFGEKPKPTTGRRLNWQLRLSAKDLNGPGCRRSAPQIRRFFRRRRIRSACWHAHRDYLYALFERVPEAGVTTSIASYQGYRDFLSHHPATANIDIGGLILPYRLAGACNCREFPHLEELIPEELAGYHLGSSRPIAEGLSGAGQRGRGGLVEGTNPPIRGLGVGYPEPFCGSRGSGEGSEAWSRGITYEVAEKG